MEIQTTTVAPRLDSSLEDTDSKKSQHQYDAVKMRYFLSLGMNRPPQMASSVPTTFSTSSSKPSLSTTTRQRTKTSPSKPVTTAFASTDSTSTNGPLHSRDHRKRAISHPIPIGAFQTSSQSQPGIPIPGRKESAQLEEGEELEFEEDESNLSVHSSEGNGEAEGEGEGENQSAEEEENFKVDEESTLRLSSSLNSASPDQFIPPHEMLKLQKTSKFDVGTAQSVAVWEQRRRKYI